MRTTAAKITLRASVVVDIGAQSHLRLSIRALTEDNGMLRDALPGMFTVDGKLTDGTLIFISDENGSHSVSYYGDGVRQKLDYVQIQTTHLGFCPPGPLMPVDATASVEAGLVSFDAVPEERWIGRNYKSDPRLLRVARRLADGEPPEEIAKDLTPVDRRALDDLTLGRASIWQVPPHVALIERRLR